ncbi:protein phosphatase 1 regulatory subunit 15A isoform X2 [Scleropages formosus]|uniref:protein phosphatase 1 regulatory subunit 15A isoform X2 n=1 Tax=Scleropages formosus TaxID=113540 RepID=UPI0010FA80AF|nr:uncharacterized protein LOC108938760 isoform X2 [Scleropages formosus]
MKTECMCVGATAKALDDQHRLWLMARAALCSVPYLCLWTSRMPGDTLCMRPSGSAHPMAHLLWKEPVGNLCRMLVRVFHSALAHLRTRLLGILWRFPPAMGTPLCSVPQFPVMGAGATDSLERVSFLSLDVWPELSWGLLEEKEESPDKELTWDAAAEEAAKDFGEDIREHPSSYLEKGREEDAGNETDKQTGMLQGHPPVKDVRTRQNQKQGVKKVRFSDAVKVHPMVVWKFASRVARDGSWWLEMARDRERFRRRVRAASDVISPCLLPQHRARVWRRIHN